MLTIFALKFFEFFYKSVNFFKRSFLKGEFFPDKVIISVGNLGFGGSGKTPLIIALAKFLRTKGIKTAIFLRGYRSKLEKNGGEVLSNDPILYGDEAVLIKRNLNDTPVFIGKRRLNNMRYLEKKSDDVKVYLLDDGFQYFEVKKDIEILIYDNENPPFLKRDFLFELKKGDIVVKRGNGKYDFQYKVEGVFPQNPESGELIAFCGIGNPDSFKKTLKKAKISFSEFIVYPDHYNYTKQDINKLLSFKKDLITTEKDFVKLEKYGIKGLYFLKISAVLNENFKKEILKKIGEKIQV